MYWQTSIMENKKFKSKESLFTNRAWNKVTKIIPILFLFFSFNALQTANAAGQSDVNNSNGEERRYVGEITKDSVENFINKNKDLNFSTIAIQSSGGDAEAALRFGEWIYENKLNVKVLHLCMSSCANYIFPAGKHKYIPKYALVIWHGSLEQKNFREDAVYYESLQLKKTKDLQSLSETEIQYLQENKFKHETIERLRKWQKQFYSKIGIDEYITRLGQEPVKYEIDGWTTSIPLMESMGISNVEAMMDYGSKNYNQKNILAQITVKATPLTFYQNEIGEIKLYEK